MAITRRFTRNGSVRVVATLIAAMLDRGLGLRATLLICSALEAVIIALGTVGPYVLKLLVDGLVPGKTPLVWAAGMSLLFVISALGGSVLAAWRQIYSQRIIDRLLEEITDDALNATMPKLAGPGHGDTGRFLGLVERLPFALQILVGGLIWQVFPTLLQVLASLAIVSSVLKPVYVAVLAVTAMAFAGATWQAAKQQHTVSGEASAAAGLLSATLSDIVRNARRVVLNGGLPGELRLVRKQSGEKAEAFDRMLISQGVVATLQYGTAATGLCCLLVLGGSDVLSGMMTIGDLVLLQAYAFRLVLPLSGFGFVVSQAAFALTTTGDVLEMGGGTTAGDAPIGEPIGAAAVDLSGVGFNYGLGLPGLHDINVRLEAGSFTAIVGPNGSGKSTLAQIIAGVIEPAEGTVLIDRKPLRDIPRAQRHRFLIYVPQTVTLLNRSLMANAQYPPSRQTEADLAQLLTQWRFYDPARDIDFTASVGEMGERLSGGQRQKLELARIAGVEVPVVILDESTSALDPVSEAEVIRTLRGAYGSKTTLVLITHRLSLAATADQVLFMKDGTVFRSGHHATLMKACATYAKLWDGTRE